MQSNNGGRSWKHCCSGIAVRITYSECMFVALGIQHTMHMRHVLLTSVACPTLPYFSTLSHKRQDFQKKKFWI